MNEDLSSIFEKLNIDKNNISPEMIENIMKMFNNSSSNTSSSSDDETSFNPEFDIDTFLKIKSIMDKINVKSTNPRSKLLYDLKPFLDKTKQNKVDQYITLDKLIELLPLLGSDISSFPISDNKVLLFSLLALLF